MKKRKILGILTFLMGIFGLISLLNFLGPVQQIHSLTISIFNFFFSGVSGIIGGIGILKGKRWGYQFGFVVWVYQLTLSTGVLFYLIYRIFVVPHNINSSISLIASLFGSLQGILSVSYLIFSISLSLFIISFLRTTLRKSEDSAL